MDKYLVSREEIDSLEGIRKAHFLNDSAQRVNKSLGDLTGLTGLGFHIIEVEPGYQSVEYHCHHHEDECVYILSGTAEATVGENIFLVKEGDFIGYRAGGKPHSIRNIGENLLRYIVVGQRLDHDVVDYPNQHKRLFRNKGLRWNLVDESAIEEPNAGKKA